MSKAGINSLHQRKQTLISERGNCDINTNTQTIWHTYMTKNARIRLYCAQY